MSRRTTLFVAGVSSRTRAKDLAREFERYGRLVRCDIPAPRNFQARPSYAFIEFEDSRDAEDAYDGMQNKLFDGYSLNVQWAKQPPNRTWRYEGHRESGRDDRDRRDYRGGRDYRDRSRSPYRSSRSPTRNRRSPSYDRSRRDEVTRAVDDDLRNGGNAERGDEPLPEQARSPPRREDEDRRKDEDEEERVRQSPVPSD
ncbi:hypothetical protein HK096_010782 [Nowakowskiella sp. JEL0078]|nr:hypothetical protein HK096_010782 [Nowakowskiella sp. JEL0078]